MKNLLISLPIVSLIAPHLKRFLMFFCLAAEYLYNDGARGGVDLIVSHFEIFACALLDRSL